MHMYAMCDLDAKDSLQLFAHSSTWVATCLATQAVVCNLVDYDGRRTEGCRMRQGQCRLTADSFVRKYHPKSIFGCTGCGQV